MEQNHLEITALDPVYRIIKHFLALAAVKSEGGSPVQGQKPAQLWTGQCLARKGLDLPLCVTPNSLFLNILINLKPQNASSLALEADAETFSLKM